jgi:hypothetical protein
VVETGADTTLSTDTGAGIDGVDAVLATVSAVDAGAGGVVGAGVISGVVGAGAGDVLSNVRAAPGSGSEPVELSASAGPEVPRATANETAPAANRR